LTSGAGSCPLERRQQRAFQLAAGRLGVVVGAPRDQLLHECLGAGPVALGGRELRDRLQWRGHGEVLVRGDVKTLRTMDSQVLAPSRGAVGERDVWELRH
jgi:hypothetical protein